MKKIFIISILSLAISLSLSAGNVSQDRAMDLAKRFFSVTDTKATESLHLVWTGSDPGTKASTEEPPFYVFTRDRGGFVIISGHDSMHPVIGFSDRNPFSVEGMPQDIRYWFSLFATSVRTARAQNLKATPQIAAEWTSISPLSEFSPIKELPTASWDQGTPFNSFCPTKGGQAAVTGCVPTAAAIIMRYHEWPEAGTGTLPGYSFDFDGSAYTENSITLGHSYDWSNMPLEYDYDWVLEGGEWVERCTNSKAQQREVATLMHDIGVGLKVRYGLSGTSGYLDPQVLIDHFGYDASCEYLRRSDYSSNQWFSIIVSEIDANRPIAYSGQDKGGAGGHQFVCDGYGTDGYIRLNLGWGGYCSGYYLPDCINPLVYDFYQQDILVGLQKNVGGKPKVRLQLVGDIGINLISGTVSRGSTFKMAVEDVWNVSETTFDGLTKLSLVDRDGKVKEDISDENDWSLDPLGPWYASTDNFTCRLNSDPEVGDHISLFYYDGSEWSQAVASHSYGYPIDEYAAIEGAMIYVDPSGYRNGDIFEFRLVNLQKSPGVSWYLDGSKTSFSSVALSRGTHTVKAAVTYSDGSSETIVQRIVVK